jgi:hypothetical protein
MDILSHNIFIQVPARVLGAMVMVFNATLKKIPVISWRSVLLLEEPEYQQKTTDLP